jgi:capsular exopolysaccharide synthesis family protein
MERLHRAEPGWGPGPAVDAPDGVEEHLVSLLTPTSFAAEQYRALRHMVEQMQKDNGLHTVAVTSPVVEDGKTTTAINLAGALAQGPQARVLLLEADLRRPSMTEHLGLRGSGDRGLVDAILHPTVSLKDVVRQRPPFNLDVLPAGHLPAACYELLKSPRLGALLDEARQLYDHIIVDTPPLVPFPDCRLIEKWIDGFLVVVAAHKTPRKLVEESLNVMDPPKVIGFVFNSDDRLLGDYDYAHGRPLSSGGRGRLRRSMIKAVDFLRRRRSLP